MRFTRGLARVLHGAAIAAGVAALGHLAKPDVIPEIVPPHFAALAAMGLQWIQAAIGQKSFDVNHDGSPAWQPAPPEK